MMTWAEERARCWRLALQYADCPSYARIWQAGWFWAVILPLLEAVGVKERRAPGQVDLPGQGKLF